MPKYFAKSLKQQFIKHFLLLSIIIFTTAFNFKSVLAQADSNTASNPKKMQISVSIAPQKFLVKRLIADNADIQVLVAQGADPHSFEPKPKQLMNVHNSAVYFSIGLPFEKIWLRRFQELSPNLRTVYIGADIVPLGSSGEAAEHDEHGEHAEHAGEKVAEGHAYHDPHIWSSPKNMKSMAIIVAKTLTELKPELSDEINKNLSQFIIEMNSLDNQIKALFADLPKEKRTFMVFHPSWGYFARDYQLTELAIEQEGKEPNPKKLAELAKKAKQDNIKVMIVQNQFSQNSAQTLASSLNVKIVAVDGLSEYWVTELLKLAHAIN